MSKYYYHIDVLKGIGIILVVLGHLNPGIYLETWIYSFHMFLFFFLSGHIFKKKPTFFDQLKVSSKSLLMPFFFWNGIAIIFNFLLKEYTLTDAVRKMFYLDGVSWNSPVWFLVVLFWTRLFYQLLSKKNIFIIIAIAFMSLFCYYSVLSSLPLGLNILPNAVIFFGLGILLSKAEISNKQCWLAIPLFAISLIGSILNSRISMYGNDFGNYILALPTGISGVLGIYLFTKLLFKPSKLCDCLQKTGKISLNIMCTHYFILRFFSILSKHFFNGYDIWKSEGFVKAAIITAVIIVIEFGIVKLFKKLNVPSSNIMRI